MWGNNAFYDPDISTRYATFSDTGGQAFLSVSHSWVAKSVDYSQRLGGKFSVFLLLVFVVITAGLVLKFVYTTLYLKLGLRQALQWMAASHECRAISCLQYFKKKGITLAGLPPYFEAIPLDSIKARLFSNNLEPHMHATYERLLELREKSDEGGPSPEADEKPVLRRSSIPAKYNKGNAEAKRASLLPPLTAPENKNAEEREDVEVGSALEQQQGQDQDQRLPSPPALGGEHAEASAAPALTIKGHESFNLRTVPSYDGKLGFSSAHLNRHFAAPGREKDYLLRSKVCERPPLDDDWLAEKIIECMPRRQRVVIPAVDGRSAPTVKMVIPAKALLLDSLLGPLGGPRAFNGIVWCECLAEPDEEGVQPRSACCSSEYIEEGESAGRREPLSSREKTSSVRSSPRKSAPQQESWDFDSVYADKSDLSGSNERRLKI